MEKRTKEIKIRLTETEHQRLLDRCDRTHLAEWLRQLGLGEHTSRKRRVPDVAPGVRLENGKYPTLSLFFELAWRAAMSEV